MPALCHSWRAPSVQADPLHLEFLDDDRIVHRIPMPAGAVNVGRSSSNDVILRHPGISGHHAMAFFEGGELRVRDLGSTNGSFLDEVRFHGEVRVPMGGTVRLGTRICMRLVEVAAIRELWILAQVDGPVAIPVDRDPLMLPGSTWSLSGSPTALVRPDGERTTVASEVPFEVDGTRWVLRPAGDTAATARSVSDAPPYDLVVDLHAPLAVLSHGREAMNVTSPLGVAMFHVLGTRWLEDRFDGWCDDGALGAAVWGRAWRNQGANNLNVLIHRTRKRATEAGLERWFLERRPGETRLRVRSVTLIDG